MEFEVEQCIQHIVVYTETTVIPKTELRFLASIFRASILHM